MLDRKDLFFQFADEYAKGHFLKAVQLIIPHPNIRYEWLQSREKNFHYLANYADASVFDSINAAKNANLALQFLIESDGGLKASCQEFLSSLRTECYFLNNEFPPFSSLSPFYKEKRQLLSHWESFRQAKPKLAALYCPENKWITSQPWHLFSYPLSPHPLVINKTAEIPSIFLQPLEGMDYSSFLAPFSGMSPILIIETANEFWHLLQFESLLPFLTRSDYYLYVLDFYPQEQFEAQQMDWRYEKTFQSILLIEDEDLKQTLPLLSQALGRENEEPWLYQIASRALFRKKAKRYGKSRCFALDRMQTLKKWFDPHKSLPPPDKEAGIPPIDHVKEKLLEYQQTRIPRPYQPQKKIKIAHVTPQILADWHAPTRLLSLILSHTDREKFDPYVISTECFTNHFLEYPAPGRFSRPSALSAQTLQSFKKQNIPTVIIQPSLTYEGSAEGVCKILKELSIDIAVFHGPDQINNISGISCNVPLRVLFEHGTLPHYPCYDLAILSTADGGNEAKSHLHQLGIQSHILYFSVDVRKNWNKDPYAKEEIGLPPGSFVLTTISNHLETRLSDEMCHAIGKILQRCPQAVYAPMGSVKNKEKFLSFFSAYGVQQRVIFLGSKTHPSQYARSMELYLNEFPFGSGVAILDAMAAGCPVVSMYDEKGPAQAKYGATFFGEEYAIRSGNAEEYVELACRLINDPLLYKEWSAHAIAQYEKQSDEAGYIKNFENIIETALFPNVLHEK